MMNRMNSQKNYISWMPVKADINNNPVRPTYKEGEIYWMSIGENVGFEQDGKGELFARPVLVITGFSRQLFWGVPLTTRYKKGRYYQEIIINGKKKTNFAILSQLRAFDSARISGMRRLGRINYEALLSIKNKLKSFL